VRQGQAHGCLLANKFLRSIGLVAQERVVDTPIPSKIVVETPTPVIVPATASTASQQSTREQGEPLRSLWVHSVPTPASPSPFLDNDTTGAEAAIVITEVTTPLLLKSTFPRPCQGWTGVQYNRLFQISYREHVLPHVKTTDAKSAAAPFGLARQFLKHANAHQLCFMLDNDKFVLRHEEKCPGHAIRKLCSRCSSLSRSVAHLVEAANKEATERLSTAQVESLAPTEAANLIDRIRSQSKQELRNGKKRETRLSARLRQFLEKRGHQPADNDDAGTITHILEKAFPHAEKEFGKTATQMIVLPESISMLVNGNRKGNKHRELLQKLVKLDIFLFPWHALLQ
jgi:hypothetical protein